MRTQKSMSEDTLRTVLRIWNLTLFEEVVSPPDIATKAVSVFRDLLAVGTRVSPIPNVAIVNDVTFMDAPGRISAITEEGAGQIGQIYIINPNVLANCCASDQACCGFTEHESVLCHVCHEARHVLQNVSRASWRGKQWWDKWCTSNLRGSFRYHGSLVNEDDYLRQHAQRNLPRDATKREVLRQMVKEIDAEVTALACTVIWRQTQIFDQVVRLLHE